MAQQLNLSQLPGGFTSYIFDGQNRDSLPGNLTMIGEGERVVNKINGEDDLQLFSPREARMRKLCNQLRHIAHFYEDVYGFKPLDGTSAVFTATTYHKKDYANCFWSIRSKHLIIGDPTFLFIGDFIEAVDVLAHEMTHGIISATSDLQYLGQAGALNEHLADVFGVLCNQYRNHRELNLYRDANAMGSDWDLGAHWFHRKPKPSAFPKSPAKYTCLRSFSDPTNAECVARQPKHWQQYQPLPLIREGDWGGVHTNSGIPNHAFYLAACASGGKPWDRIGRVWFATMIEKRLGGHCTFARFAGFTIEHAKSVGADLQKYIRNAWAAVGVTPDHIK